MTRMLALLVLLAPACGDVVSTEVPTEAPKPSSADASPIGPKTTPVGALPLPEADAFPVHYAPADIAAQLEADDFDADASQWGAGADLVTLAGERVFIDLQGADDDPDCRGTSADGRLNLECDLGPLDASWKLQDDGSVLTDLLSLAHSRAAAEQRLVPLSMDLQGFTNRARSKRAAAIAGERHGRYRSSSGQTLEIGKDGVIKLDGEAVEATLVDCYARGVGGSDAPVDSQCLVLGNGNPALSSYVWSGGWVAGKVVEDYPAWGLMVKEDAALFSIAP